MSANDASEMIHDVQAEYAIASPEWPEEPLIVERAGRPAAVIISLEEYRRFLAWREERAARRAWVLAHDPRSAMTNEQWRAQFATMDRFAAHFEDITDKELTDELTQAITAVRAEQARR